MSEGLLIFDSRKPKVRIALFGLIALAFVFVFFSVRWQLGDMMAELTSPTDVNVSQISELAETLAPQDPRAKWLAASAVTSVFSPEAIDSSVQLFGDTVRLSPYDFRWWLEYGRSLEKARRPKEAEAALNYAIGIAPNYAYPRWQLGNFFLRQDRTTEALEQLKLATRNNPTYRNQVFALIWDYFGHDPAKVEQIAADTAGSRADLALFFAVRLQPAEALKIWNSLSDEQKTENQVTAKTTTQVLYQTHAFREALEFARQTGIDPDAAAETITDPGFESPIRSSEETFFGWKIDRSDGKADVAPDSNVKHSGKRGLRITFRSYTKQNLYQIWQNIAIAPSTHYKLSFWIRTENLRSGGPPVIEIVNAADDKVLTVSTPFPLGTNEWQQVTIEFTTPDDGTGISMRTSRGYCGETCPIVGIVWLDDFSLIKA